MNVNVYRITATFTAFLVVPVTAEITLSVPLQSLPLPRNVFAQSAQEEIKITTSANTGDDSGGSSFYGKSVLQVLISDESADFEEMESDKEFTFELPIAGARRPSTMNSASPQIFDLAGSNLAKASAGQQVTHCADISNNKTYPLNFVSIIEVRDSYGVTPFLAWQTGTVGPNGKASVSISWIPIAPESYSIRTFVLDKLISPQILSDVQSTTFTVSS